MLPMAVASPHEKGRVGQKYYTPETGTKGQIMKKLLVVIATVLCGLFCNPKTANAETNPVHLETMFVSCSMTNDYIEYDYTLWDKDGNAYKVEDVSYRLKVGSWANMLMTDNEEILGLAPEFFSEEPEEQNHMSYTLIVCFILAGFVGFMVLAWFTRNHSNCSICSTALTTENVSALAKELCDVNSSKKVILNTIPATAWTVQNCAGVTFCEIQYRGKNYSFCHGRNYSDRANNAYRVAKKILTA